MATSTFSSHILYSYTIPYTILLILYICYVLMHILFSVDLGLSHRLFMQLVQEHYVTALVYTAHKLILEFNRATLLATIGECFVLFPLHFIHTMYQKINHSLELMKLNPPDPAEASSLLHKIRFTPPLHTFVIVFTCLQIPMEVFSQMSLFIVAFGDSSTKSAFQLSNLTICLFLMTCGVVFYFRYETQNMSRLSFESLKKILHAENQETETANLSSGKTADPSLKTLKPPEDQAGQDIKVTESHGPVFRIVVILILLLHCYVRLICLGLALFEEDKITGLFLISHSVLFLLVLLLWNLNLRPKVNICYIILQSLLLNLCLIEYKIKLANRRLVFAAYFLLMAAENVFFAYLFYSRFHWDYWEAKRPPGPYRWFFNGTKWSLIAAQALQLVLLFGYLTYYKSQVREIETVVEGENCDAREKKTPATLIV